MEGGAGRVGGSDGRLDRLVSDAERDAAASTLGEAASHGILTPAEFDERMTAALAARRLGELQALTADLPQAGMPDVRVSHPRPWWRHAGFDHHATAYVLVNGLLVGTWALTGHQFFWPFFPIAGWGIGLGAHGMSASSVAHSRRQRSARRALARTSPGPGGAVPRAGAPAVGRPARQRYVAVLFADMVGSTALNELLGDTAFNEVRVACLRAVRSAVAAEGGTEVSSQGDGLFARFGDPGAAVRAAVGVQRWAASPAAPDAGGGPLHLHVGVHAGPAIEDGSDLIGNMVNLAARVTAVAGSGEVLVTESVADLASGFTFEDRGMHELKGVARPRHLLAVAWH